eukprot:Em0622g4a
MLRVCERLGIPVALDKLEGPATTITFLGITINTTLQQSDSTCTFRIPQASQSQRRCARRYTRVRRFQLIFERGFNNRVNSVHLEPVCLCPSLDHGHSRSDPLP